MHIQFAHVGIMEACKLANKVYTGQAMPPFNHYIQSLPLQVLVGFTTHMEVLTPNNLDITSVGYLKFQLAVQN